MFICSDQYAAKVTRPLCAVLLLLACTSSLYAGESEPGVTIGPFTSPELMERVYPTLQRNLIRFQTRQTSQRESLGFIVVSPVQRSAQDGQEAIAELNSVAVTDVVYIRSGVYAGRVSVGVYSTRQRAQNRAEALQGLGFDVEVFERIRGRFEGWLDLDTQALGKGEFDAIVEIVGESVQVISPEIVPPVAELDPPVAEAIVEAPVPDVAPPLVVPEEPPPESEAKVPVTPTVPMESDSLVNREPPQLCWGGTQSLTITGVS